MKERERITKRDDSGYRDGYVMFNVSDAYANQMYHKLRDLEDIEDELGIDLVTLFKILRTGGHIYVKNCKGINYWHVESLKQRGLNKQWYITYSNNVRVKLKDYGETWALTKEELEK